jgi:anti-sigma factor RsiW
MTILPHEQAREFIVLGEDLSAAQQIALRAHLTDCDACRQYAESANTVVRALRSLPLAADSRLVRATQMRVRFHAARLRETRERMWLVGIASLLAGLSATVTIPLAWRLFAWLGHSAGVAPVVWETGFAFFWIAPAAVASAFLLARGTHSSVDRDKHARGENR